MRRQRPPKRRVDDCGSKELTVGGARGAVPPTGAQYRGEGEAAKPGLRLDPDAEGVATVRRAVRGPPALQLHVHELPIGSDP